MLRTINVFDSALPLGFSKFRFTSVCKLSYYAIYTVDAVKAGISTWRTTDDGHLPSMQWSFNGGNPDIGGSQVGYWGNEGGLFSKIVRCDDIPEKFMYYQYPSGTATSDFIDPGTNETISEMVYQWWTEYGGYNETGDQVFGEAPSLPAECAPCIEAMPCFDWTGCSFLDFESQTWSAPYDVCTPAFACLPCYPECTVPEAEVPATPSSAPVTPTTAPVVSTTTPVSATSAPTDSSAVTFSVTGVATMMMMMTTAGFLF